MTYIRAHRIHTRRVEEQTFSVFTTQRSENRQVGLIYHLFSAVIIWNHRSLIYYWQRSTHALEVCLPLLIWFNHTHWERKKKKNYKTYTLSINKDFYSLSIIPDEPIYKTRHFIKQKINKTRIIILISIVSGTIALIISVWDEKIPLFTFGLNVLTFAISDAVPYGLLQGILTEPLYANYTGRFSLFSVISEAIQPPLFFQRKKKSETVIASPASHL